MLDFAAAVRELLPELIAFRHDLHAHPETAYQERRTSGKVLDAITPLPGLHIRTGLAGGTGILATLNRDKAGPCVLLRADMDALPIEETTDLPYKSTCPGKMHACGHDGHTAALVGAVRVLSRFAGELPGKVKFCFQPAEEDGAGGDKMVEDGVLDDPHVDAAFALHGWPAAPLDQVIACDGPILAATASFRIDFVGRGGHAGYPHKASDVLVAASQFVTNIQAIRSRFVDPLDPVVVSITQIEGGFTYNVLPERCHLKGTIRALSEHARAIARRQLETFLNNVASSFDVRAELTWADQYPPLINDAKCAALVREVARDVVGEDNVVAKYPSSMGAEDFAYFARRVPAAMFRIGLCPPGVDSYPSLHNPAFDFNDDILSTAVMMHCRIAERMLNA